MPNISVYVDDVLYNVLRKEKNYSRLVRESLHHQLRDKIDRYVKDLREAQETKEQGV